ncbi:DnaB-like helicase N-terminal domain-containing protein [Actinoplanes sp. NPDC051851]|uniref:DnaB-like helicase N-terminal domain-containing protein n=1 Tax=Actinoplanes sp. NPDC051851 TaxID=3154753 RepID=UPI00344815E5
MTDQLAVEAERMTLGAMICGGVERALQIVAPGDFYDPRHGMLAAYIAEMHREGEVIDPVLLGKRLADRGELNRVPGGIVYLLDLYKDAPASTQVGYYARIVADEAHRRGVAVLAAQIGDASRIEDRSTRRTRLSQLRDVLDAHTSETRTDTPRRRVNLLPFLNGTYNPPPPSIGGERDDNRQMLYPGRWHTLVAPTAAGKSWFAVWHVVAELRRGNTVAYAHFEEHNPAGMVDRIRSVAPELTIEDLVDRFIWLDCSSTWRADEFAAALPERPSLIVLDGIVAACSQHGWVADKPEAVGAYRELFITPATKTGAAVISLGHPVKARDRQAERHGFGASAWLDEVDGVAFRLEASKSPIRRDQRGFSTLFCVKDRYGQVEAAGQADARRDGWFYLGAFTVDSSTDVDNTVAFLTAPSSVTDPGAVTQGSMPVVLMAAMSAELAKQGHALSQNAVLALVPGKTDAKRAALEFLVNGEFVVQTKRGNTFLHRHHKPFLLDPEDDSDE